MGDQKQNRFEEDQGNAAPNVVEDFFRTKEEMLGIIEEALDRKVNRLNFVDEVVRMMRNKLHLRISDKKKLQEACEEAERKINALWCDMVWQRKAEAEVKMPWRERFLSWITMKRIKMMIADERGDVYLYKDMYGNEWLGYGLHWFKKRVMI